MSTPTPESVAMVHIALLVKTNNESIARKMYGDNLVNKAIATLPRRES